MNILLVSGPGISLKEPYNSGIESFIVSFANQLVDEGHAVDVVAAEAEAGARFRVIDPFIKYSAARPAFLNTWSEKRRFKNLDFQSYDVVHYHMFYPHLLKAGLSFNKPTFLTLHSPADTKRISAYKRLARRGDITFIAISKRIKQQWEQALGKDMPPISNGIDLNLWPTRSAGNGRYLLWSARINSEKNVAAAIRLANHMKLPLKIAGRIVDQEYFYQEVRPYLSDRIQYEGHLTQLQLSKLAQKAIAYLATATWQEPFGLAALEMLASGVPVVGFNTAVPPDWTSECISTTDSLLWQDLERMVQKSYVITPGACKEFASKLSVQKMTSTYIKLYRKVLMQKGISDPEIPVEKRLMQLVTQQTETSK